MKRIFLTVDVECHDLEHVNSYVYGKIGGRYYGIDGIIDAAEEYKIPINFFFDTPEAFRYGEEYAKGVIQSIQSRGHNVYFHLHPNYVSGDDSRSFFWQYNPQEQEEIFGKALDGYLSLLETSKCVAFRMGRYGTNESFYQMLENKGFSLIDLSYCYKSRNMCKLTCEEVHTANLPRMFHNQLIFPNTRYLALQFGKRSFFLGLDVSETCYSEFCDVIDHCRLNNVVLTMHSWNFLNRYFFARNLITANTGNIKKFRKMIEYAQQKGYVFSDVKDVSVDADPGEDHVYNPFEQGLLVRLRYYYYNFVRCLDLAKMSRKYFVICTLAFLSLLLAVTALIVCAGALAIR